MSNPDHDVVVIGGGQAGLAIAWYLKRAGIDFIVLDAEDRPGGAWLHTWGSLSLFSPAAWSSLPGWPMPSSQSEHFPMRDEHAHPAPENAQRVDAVERLRASADLHHRQRSALGRAQALVGERQVIDLGLHNARDLAVPFRAKCAKSGELVKGEKQLFAHGVERAIVHLPLLDFPVKYPGGLEGDGAIVDEDRKRAYPVDRRR